MYWIACRGLVKGSRYRPIPAGVGYRPKDATSTNLDMSLSPQNRLVCLKEMNYGSLDES